MFPESITCRDSLSGTKNGDWDQPRVKKALERQGCMEVNSPWDKGSKKRLSHRYAYTLSHAF